MASDIVLRNPSIPGATRFPSLQGRELTLEVGARVQVRYDKKIYTITGVSELPSGWILTLEHEALITKQRTVLHTSYLNVERVVA